MYTLQNCTDESLSSTNLENRYVILKTEFFKSEYQNEKYQLVLAKGGFGCDPNKIGNAIFVAEIFENGESYRIDRCDHNILGLASETTIAEYKEKYC